ncbi:hypothetical protein V8E55_004263 [Tylopilus felleus]
MINIHRSPESYQRTTRSVRTNHNKPSPIVPVSSLTFVLETYLSIPTSIPSPHACSLIPWCSIKRSPFQSILFHVVRPFHRTSTLFPLSVAFCFMFLIAIPCVSLVASCGRTPSFVFCLARNPYQSYISCPYISRHPPCSSSSDIILVYLSSLSLLFFPFVSTLLFRTTLVRSFGVG